MSRIFLSYTNNDRKLAEKLKRELERAGVEVWIDYEKLGTGDSLEKSIIKAINEIDYLAVLLSPRSLDSIWVQKEVKYALQLERKNKKTKVLPILYEKCVLPKIIEHKIFADFTIDYDKGFNDLLKPLLFTNQKKLDYLKKLYPVLNDFQQNINNNNINSLEWLDSLEVSGIANEKIDEFLNLITAEIKDAQLYIIAYFVLHCILRMQAGHEVWESILARDLLSRQEKEDLGFRMTDCSDKKTIIWCHEQLIYKIKQETPYCAFVEKHLELLIEEQYHAMLAYLLSFRGPGFDNLITYFIVINHIEHPGKLVKRCIDWVKNGRFDGNRNEGDVTGELLYRKINRTVDKNRNKIEALIEALHNHVYSLLTSGSQYFKGVYHVISMLSSKYVLIKEANDLISPVLGTYFRYSGKELLLLDTLKKTMAKSIDLQSGPGNKNENDLMHLLNEIHKNDEISGFWENSKRKYSAG